MNRRFFLTALSMAMAAERLRAAPASSSRFLLFLGTRSGLKGQGIYSCLFDSGTGACSSVSLAADLEQPTCLAVGADARYLYSVSETGNDGKSDGSLAAFAIDRHSAGLKLLNQVSSGGGGPTYISLDNTDKTALVANFGSGSTTAFRLLPDGRLGEQTASMAHSGSGPHRRQAGPHAHSITLSPDNRFALVPDLGADRVFIFRLDAVGGLTPHDPPFVSLPAGSGPRRLVFHPGGRFAYLLSELVARITVFAWDVKNARLLEIQTVSAVESDDQGPPSGAGMAMHPGGRFLYTTTRNDSAIEVFGVDRAKGTLAARQRVASRGKSPWGCTIDPAGRLLLAMNQASDSVAIFRIDPGTGKLTPAGPLLKVPAPVCALFVPA